MTDRHVKKGVSHDIKVGDVLHGFQSGAFGRDSYDCRRVEAVGTDWVLTRCTHPLLCQNEVEMVSGERLRWLESNGSCDGAGSPCDMEAI